MNFGIHQPSTPPSLKILAPSTRRILFVVDLVGEAVAARQSHAQLLQAVFRLQRRGQKLSQRCCIPRVVNTQDALGNINHGMRTNLGGCHVRQQQVGQDSAH